MNTAIAVQDELNQAEIGLYGKFKVIRNDGKDAPDASHHGDEYFVLNLTTDKHAIPAISAYAKSCDEEYPLLAKDLRALVTEKTSKNNEFVIVPETLLPNGIKVLSFQVGKYASSKSDIGTVLVVADRKPWNQINYHEAVKACKDSGLNLITELQYLAIAYQITQQDINWTGGKVGQGEVYRGLHLGTVNEAQDGHYESEYPIERRWHVLANGESIYDISGNIYSWVFDDVQGDENGIVSKPFTDDSATVTTAPYKSREHGIGDTSVGDWSGRAIVRGGCWSSRDLAGVFLVYHGWPHLDYDFVGFRCTKSL